MAAHWHVLLIRSMGSLNYLLRLMLQGTAADIAIHAQEIMFLRKKLNEIYKQHTHQDLETLGELASESAEQAHLTDEAESASEWPGFHIT